MAGLLAYPYAMAMLVVIFGWMIFGPLITVYLVWRAFHDLRRIAVALEASNKLNYSSLGSQLADATPFEEAQIRGVANSAFGR